jgi:sulfide:quinone oxidoreductase
MARSRGAPSLDAMTLPASPPRGLRVVIAGGGVAAAEAALALRALTGSGLELMMVAPTDRLHYHPLTVVEPFACRATRHYPLDEICAGLGVVLLQDTLVGVEPATHAILTGSGERIEYDALIVATGARAGAGLARAHTFFAEADPQSMHWIVRELEERRIRRATFVVPPGRGWSLPIYELALMTAARVRDMGVEDAELTLVTPEPAPLAIFHGAGSAAVAALLRAARIAFVPGSYAHDYDGRRLVLTPGDRTLEADRAIALPLLRGPAIDGLPCDPDGFVHVDDHGRVPDCEGVFAVGDATTFALKQGGLAAQQADVAAALVAQAAGVEVIAPDVRPRLRAVLFTGDGPLYLRATMTGGESVVSTASHHCPWWPPQKVAARHLAPYLADRDEVDPETATRHALAARLTGPAAVVHRGEGECVED